MKKRPNRPTLKLTWKLYQMLGKEKLEKEGTLKRISTVSFEQFTEMIHLVEAKGETPFEKQSNWTIIVMSFGLERFAQVIREMFNGN